MPKYLIKFSFGPVKDFLSAGRKIEDLFAGSSILNDLMKEVQLLLPADTEIIYPLQSNTSTSAPEDNNSNGDSAVNLPNILLASVKSDDIAAMADYLKNEAIAAFKRNVSGILNSEKFTDQFNKEHLEQIIERQTASFLDISWAFAEWDDQDKSFKPALQLLNTRFDATKRTRQFSQLEEPGVKCVLQTSLSALWPLGKNGNDAAITNAWQQLFKDPGSKISMRKGECFSAIGLAKRMYNRTNDGFQPFPSTYSIATAHWRKRLLEHITSFDSDETRNQDQPGNDLKNKIEDFDKAWRKAKKDNIWDLSEVSPSVIPALRKLNHSNNHILLNAEAQCFTMTKPLDPDVKEAVDPLEDSRTKLVNKSKQNGLGTPPKHYALLIADGDSMGTIVDNRGTKNELVSLSQALHSFSCQAKALIENDDSLGRIIFAGGDDVLGVMPLDNALEAACTLRQIYQETLREFADEAGKIPTLSVALLVAPVNYPLHRLLENADHTLNQEAKKGEKDALVIKVFKGHSEAVSVTLPTTAFYQENKAVCNLAGWAELLRRSHLSGDLSSSAVYALQRDLTALDQDPGNSPGGRGLSREEKLALAEKLIYARLGTLRGINKTKLLIVRNLLRRFSQAIKAADVGRTENPFNNILLPAKTLITLRNLWRLKCL